jgi:hypothetical protein
MYSLLLNGVPKPVTFFRREYGDLKHADDYDVTLLVSHESVNKDPMTIFIKFYVIMTSKREYYPRLLMEKKPGKFRTVSTATPVKKKVRFILVPLISNIVVLI